MLFSGAYGGIAILLRTIGNPKSFAELVGYFSAAVGELLALREGLLLAKHLNLTVHIYEVDTVNVAHDINSSGSINYVVKFVVNDVRVLIQEVGTSLCQTISRVGNSLAHDLDSLAISLGKE
ncbi:hypothetical protein QYF36_010733 [Acer negundo]|nr:hypothetical protein QYF36_010733 [Acer negundo]